MVNMFTALKKYAVFEGRARRSEFWLFFLLQLIIYVVLGILGSVMGGGHAAGAYGMYAGNPLIMGIEGILGLALLLPNIGVAVRRLHDSDKTGWLLLIGLIPLLGFLILLVLYILPGTEGPNKYGPDPKSDGASAPAAA